MPAAMGLTEGEVADLPIHIRGSFLTLGSVAPRGFPVILAGNSVTVGPFTARVDKKAPGTAASARKADNGQYNEGTWSNQDVTVTLSASDGGSGVASITYSLNGKTAVVVSGSTAVPSSSDRGAGFRVA